MFIFGTLIVCVVITLLVGYCIRAASEDLGRRKVK